jgi:hypothetical protein
MTLLTSSDSPLSVLSGIVRLVLSAAARAAFGQRVGHGRTPVASGDALDLN